MAFESNDGRNVTTFFGPRTSKEGLIGSFNVDGAVQELILEVTGQNILDDVFALRSDALIPAGSLVIRAYAEVSEAFVLGGTTPTIDIGTDGSEGTNGFDLAEAEAENVGLVINDPADMAGTWAARFAADTRVSVVLGGGTPTVTAAGLLKVVIEYVKV